MTIRTHSGPGSQLLMTGSLLAVLTGLFATACGGSKFSTSARSPKQEAPPEPAPGPSQNEEQKKRSPTTVQAEPLPSAGPSAAPELMPLPEPVPLPEPALPSPVATQNLGASAPICVQRTDAPEFRYSVPRTSEPSDPFNNFVQYSQSFEIDIAQSSGDTWPVSKFAVDDVAFLLRPQDSIAISTTQDPGFVTFTLPAGAIALADLTPNGQSGWLVPGGDIKHDKVYRQVGRDGWSVVLRRNMGETIYLNDLRALGFPVVTYNQLTKTRLREMGLLDAAGVLRFKVASIVHGSGDLDLQFGFGCQ